MSEISEYNFRINKNVRKKKNWTTLPFFPLCFPFVFTMFAVVYVNEGWKHLDSCLGVILLSHSVVIVKSSPPSSTSFTSSLPRRVTRRLTNLTYVFHRSFSPDEYFPIVNPSNASSSPSRRTVFPLLFNRTVCFLPMFAHRLHGYGTTLMEGKIKS